jgi:hypothetical protein
MSTRERRAILAFAGLVLAAVIAGVVLYATSGSSAPPARAIAPTAPVAAPRFPAPPPGSVVFAREDRSSLLALALPPVASGGAAQVSVVGDAGNGVDGLHVSLRITRASGVTTTTATACGEGCYRAPLGPGTAPRSLQVRVVRPSRTTVWNVSLPATWPPQDATAIVARARRVWTQLTSISYLDRLGSDASNVLVAHWQIVAPDRLAYQIEHGGQAVIIGLRRWDRPTAGAAWQESSAVRLHQPQPFWVTATDAHVLGSGTFDGHAVWHISFYDPRTPGWFEVSIDKRTARTLDMHMDATAHFMHDTYGQFDAPIKIVPPTSNHARSVTQ